MKVYKENQCLLQGHRSTNGDGLWDVPIPKPDPPPVRTAQHITTVPHLPSPSMNVIIRKDKTAKDLAVYLHAACFSPTKHTFLQAIKRNHFLGWPGLTPTLIANHLPLTAATIQGHLRQEQQGLQSTQHSTSAFNDVDLYPTSDLPNKKTHDVIYAITTKQGKAYMDLTGRFPHCSSRGNNYILVAYHYNNNAILGEPLKNRQAATITQAWKLIHQKLSRAAESPNTWILDNEASQDLKFSMVKSKTDYQLVPPHTHRANSAERAIQTFKAHFIAGLSSLDPDFPVSEWDRLLNQAFLTLNLLRTARANPSLSAHAYLFGNFNFNATPLAPPGTRVFVHLKPTVRGSWDSRAQEGWYIGPSMHHYRCVKCFLPTSRREIDADTVVFMPKHIPFPEVTLHDFLHQTVYDIFSLLTNPPTSTNPTLTAGDDLHNAIYQIASLLHRDNNTPSILNKLNKDFQHQLSQFLQKHITQHIQYAFQPTAPNVPTLPSPPVTRNIIFPSSSLTISNTLDQLARVLQSRLTRHKTLTNHLQTQSTQLFSRQPLQPFTPSPSVPTANHIYNADGKKLTLELLLQGEDGDTWKRSASNEFG